MNNIEQKIIDIIDRHSEELIALGDYMYSRAERGFNEHNTAALIAQKLEAMGLEVTKGLAHTGLKAWVGSDNGPNLALISELDGILCPAHPQAAPDGMSHSCGHHAQMVTMLGAALALSDPEIAKTLGGTATFFAVPSEEFLSEDIRSGLRANKISTHSGGKAELIFQGLMEDVDLAITTHAHMLPYEGFDLVLGNNACTGFIGKTATFKGKAAHAAGAPHAGINAMNAAALALSALGMIRETFQEKDYVRVHPIIKEAGTAINVIPDTAVLDMMVRASNLKAVAAVSEKVDRAFKGAAYAIGAEVEISDTIGYLPVLERPADAVMIEAAKLLGDDVRWTPATMGIENMASTDVGDLTHLMPVLNYTFGGFEGALHSRDFKLVDAEKAFIVPAKLMALTAYRLLRDNAAEANKITQEFKPALTKAEYLEYIK